MTLYPNSGDLFSMLPDPSDIDVRLRISPQKKIFAYIKEYTATPGLSNNWIRSWLASLSRSILIRYASRPFNALSHSAVKNTNRPINMKLQYEPPIWIAIEPTTRKDMF